MQCILRSEIGLYIKLMEIVNSVNNDFISAGIIRYPRIFRVEDGFIINDNCSLE